jgi:hypothetical protein
MRLARARESEGDAPIRPTHFVASVVAAVPGVVLCGNSKS